MREPSAADNPDSVSPQDSRGGEGSENAEHGLSAPATINGSIALIAVILGITAFTFLAPILFPLIVAIFLFFVIRSITDAFVRRGIGRPVMYLTLLTLLIVGTLIGAEVVTSNAQRFQEVFPEYRTRLVEYVAAWTDRDQDPNHDTSVLSETLNVTLAEIMQFAFGHAIGIAEFVLLVFFYLIFILIGAEGLPRRVERAFSGKLSGRLLQIGEGIRTSIQRYVRLKTVVSGGMALVAALLMAPFQLDFWPLWVFLTFALNYITYIGSLAALVPPIVVAFLQFDSVTAAGLLSTLLCVSIDSCGSIMLKYGHRGEI
jgi:AI-2 transport protein TqsA